MPSSSQLSYDFFRRISWSALSGVGNSPMARLTILMPVIGYLIVFNSNISGWLKPLLPLRKNLQPDIWDYLYDKNLVFLYFGLLVFGIGVTIFTAMAPAPIRKFPHVEDYIRSMQDIRTRNLVIGGFEHVAGAYQKELSDEEQSGFYSHYNKHFPEDVSDGFHRLVEHIYQNSYSEDSDDAAEIELRNYSEFHTGSGYLKTNEIVDIMYSGRRVDAALNSKLYANITAYSKDVFYLEHKTLDFSKPRTRLLILLFYLSGMTLAFIPTALTSIIIIKDWSLP